MKWKVWRVLDRRSRSNLASGQGLQGSLKKGFNIYTSTSLRLHSAWIASSNCLCLFLIHALFFVEICSLALPTLLNSKKEQADWRGSHLAKLPGCLLLVLFSVKNVPYSKFLVWHGFEGLCWSNLLFLTKNYGNDHRGFLFFVFQLNFTFLKFTLQMKDVNKIIRNIAIITLIKIMG